MKPMEFVCPKCGGEYICGCGSCKERNKDKIISIFHGDDVECGHCGYTADGNIWMDAEWDQFTAWKKERGCSSCCHFEIYKGCPLIMKCKNYSEWEK